MAHEVPERGPAAVERSPGVYDWSGFDRVVAATEKRGLELMPIILGAGGIITTWEGGPPNAGGRIVAAGDKRVHAAALAALKG